MKRFDDATMSLDESTTAWASEGSCQIAETRGKSTDAELPLSHNETSVREEERKQNY